MHNWLVIQGVVYCTIDRLMCVMTCVCVLICVERTDTWLWGRTCVSRGSRWSTSSGCGPAPARRNFSEVLSIGLTFCPFCRSTSRTLSPSPIASRRRPCRVALRHWPMWAALFRSAACFHIIWCVSSYCFACSDDGLNLNYSYVNWCSMPPASCLIAGCLLSSISQWVFV